MAHQKILILDFGPRSPSSSPAACASSGKYCELHPFDVSDEFIAQLRRAGRHPLRRPNSVPRPGLARTAGGVRARRAGAGICYGMQTMASQLGGRSRGSAKREFGYAGSRAGHSAVRRHRGPQQRRRPRPARRVDEPRRQGHRAAAGLQDHRQQRPTPIAAMADEARGFYGVQFHPEVTHTIKGKAHDRALRARHLRLRHDWNMPGHRGSGAEDPRAGRRREVILACRAASILRWRRR